MQQKCETPGFDLIQVVKTNNFDLNKKRKWQAEEFDLPTPKHKCCDLNFPCENVSWLDKNPNADEMVLSNGPEHPQSENGSNSFEPDSDSIMSVSNEVHMEPEQEMTSPCNYRPTNSRFDYALDDSHSLEEHLLEFGNHIYSCTEYEDGNIEQCKEKEVEELLFSNGVIPNMYALSSDRWDLDQEVQSGCSRKPTIDQEFEQYFSMLML